MAKRSVSKQELLDTLNRRLKEHPEGGEDCSIPSVFQLHEADEEGCNWEVGIVRGSGISSKECLGTAQEVVKKARSEFNLK